MIFTKQSINVFKSLKYLSFMMAFILSGCLNLGTSIVNMPTYFSSLERHADISYGQDYWQKLDIYSSKAQTNDNPRPVVIFFYGGRWSSGAKEQYRFVAARMVKAGYIVVIPDYIKYPQAKFPAFMYDAARSVVWVKQNIAKYGGETSKLYVLGHSAGAHIGSLLISDESYLKAQGSSPKIITAFAGLAGPYAFTPDEPDLKDMFGPPKRYTQMQVTTFIDGQEPPMLLLYGKEDNLVKPYNLTRLSDAILAHKGKVNTKIYPNMGHIGIIASFAKADNLQTPVAQDCIDFFNKHPPLKKAGK